MSRWYVHWKSCGPLREWHDGRPSATITNYHHAQDLIHRHPSSFIHHHRVRGVKEKRENVWMWIVNDMYYVPGGWWKRDREFIHLSSGLRGFLPNTHNLGINRSSPVSVGLSTLQTTDSRHHQSVSSILPFQRKCKATRKIILRCCELVWMRRIEMETYAEVHLISN